jgi:benzodiazapine receptor
MKTGFAGKVAICCVGILVLGGLGGFLTSGNMGWYELLKRPPGTPPGWVFGPVWTVLYLMMGASLALLWQNSANEPRARRAVVAFIVQLLLNLAWTPVFFGLQRIDIALGVIVALWIAIVVTIAAARPVSRTAAWLLVPYYAWVSYATYLNAGFFLFNRP